MRYGESGEIDWDLGGSRVPKKNIMPLEKTQEKGVASERESQGLKGKSVEFADKSGDEFDADEEEAMVQAVVEMEKQKEDKEQGKGGE